MSPWRVRSCWCALRGQPFIAEIAGPCTDAACPCRARQELCEEARRRWPICRIAIVHRTGTVLVGEPSVVIAVSSAHRKAALEASSFASPASLAVTHAAYELAAHIDAVADGQCI